MNELLLVNEKGMGGGGGKQIVCSIFETRP